MGPLKALPSSLLQHCRLHTPYKSPNPTFIFKMPLKHLLIFLLLHTTSSYKPNVLFIILDDLKPVLGCYGDQQAYTPNIDKLASKSFLFEEAYAQQALCAPSRNSLLTSRRPDSLHLYDFYSYWREAVGNFTTLPQYFKENGYLTYSIGKVFHPGISSNFSDDQPYSWSWKPFHPKTFAYKNAKVCPNRDGSLGMNLICPVITEFQPMGTLPDIESTHEAVRFLKNHPHPFFLAVGLHKPHIPFKFPVEFLDFHPLDNVSLPKYRSKPPLMPNVAWNPWVDIRERDDMKSLNISFPFGPISDGVTKKIIQAYYSSVTYVDDLIGRILSQVDLNRTIIILTSDHGWSMGQHGEFSKYSNFQQATRVPLIIHVPHLSKSQVKVQSMVELVDIFPTLVDLTQVGSILERCPSEDVKVDACTEGMSMLPVMLQAVENQQEKGKSAVFTQYPRPGLFPSLRPNSDKPHLKEIKIMGYSMKTDLFRYCEWMEFGNFSGNWDKVYATELYDLTSDPDENNNIADRKELEKLRKHLATKLKSGWRHA